jgi:hypothetical protein
MHKGEDESRKNDENEHGILYCLRNVVKLRPNAENQPQLQNTKQKFSQNFQRPCQARKINSS